MFYSSRGMFQVVSLEVVVCKWTIEPRTAWLSWFRQVLKLQGSPLKKLNVNNRICWFDFASKDSFACLLFREHQKGKMLGHLSPSYPKQLYYMLKMNSMLRWIEKKNYGNHFDEYSICMSLIFEIGDNIYLEKDFWQ